MPEGDAVWRTAHRLHRAMAGWALAGADLRTPRTATAGRELVGRHTIEVVPRGKHLLHRLEGSVTLHSHLRMEGSWQVHPVSRRASAAARHTVRALVWTERLVAIGDQLGMLDVLPTQQEHRVVGHLGPDLLDPAFDREQALAAVLSAPERTVAEALLDQRNLAGLGTIFTAEPLFLTGINPWAPVGELSRDEIGAVLDTARRLLVLSAREGRTTGTGAVGDGASTRTWVHGRSGLPCRRCGDTVRVAPIGAQPRDRVMFSCPTCQGGRAPTDPGGEQTPLGHR